jgi:endonuclease YncB( thermonuclease family)
MTKFNCRLVGLDTPEIKPPMSKPNRDEEIAAAKRCRHRLIQLSTNCRMDDTANTNASKKDIMAIINDNTKLIRVSCSDFDKYGRLLVTLYDANFDTNALESTKSYNTILIEERFAKPYNGGTKDGFSITL